MKYLIIILCLTACGKKSDGGSNTHVEDPTPPPPIVEIIEPVVTVFNEIQEMNETVCDSIVDWQNGLIDDADNLLVVANINAQNIWWLFDKDGLQQRSTDINGNEYNWGGYYTDETFNIGQCMIHIVNSLVGVDEVYWEGTRIL